MSQWITIRLNLQYYWKTVLIWAIGIGGALVFVLWAMSGRANAWVEDFQPFPDGEAQVIVHRFCRSQFCGYPSQGEWQRTIRSVMAEWNNAGSAFVFREGPANRTGDPCRQPDTVTVILADPDQLCRGDGPLRAGARTEFQSFGSSTSWQVRVYINAGSESAQDPASLRRLLLHEFGHAVGLGHPDDAGQNVAAIMNSVIYYNHLQSDDLAGIRALYPSETDSSSVRGRLENPAPDSFQSGIGMISGWACEATDRVEIEISGRKGPAPYHQRWWAAYGTSRGDTSNVCGDSDNGFGLLFNWNNLGPGRHRVVVSVDGHEIGRASFTVTTLGEEFLKGATGGWVLGDFPDRGQSVEIQWSESLQNFVITGTSFTPESDYLEEEEECQYPHIAGACGEDG